MRMGLGAVAALAITVLAVGCGGDDGDSDSESSTLSAADSTEEAPGSEASTAADGGPPTVKARAAKAAVGEPVALRFSVTDDSGATRENITIWKGEKRQQLIARKEFEPTPESGDERTTTLEAAELGKWKSKPGKYRWCVRAFDEAGNKSKVSCATLTLTKAGSGAQTSTSEQPGTSGDDATATGDTGSTEDRGSSDEATSTGEASSEDDSGSTG